MNGTLLQEIEAQHQQERNLNFKVGDTVRVHFRIIEGSVERIQVYEGLVIAIKNSSLSKTFCVRKISFGVGVERIFPLYSPRIQKIERVRAGKVRKAKLYYIRGRVGKTAKVKELIGAAHATSAAETK